MGVERGEKEGLAGPPVELEMSNLFILSKHDCNFITFSLCIVQISHMVWYSQQMIAEWLPGTKKKKKRIFKYLIHLVSEL